MNILIVGLGSIARKHIIAIRQLYHAAHIYALRSENPSNESDDIHNIYRLEDLRLKPDFIIISNPTYLHADTIIKCAELGVPLFIEKPVIDSLEKAEEILNIFSNNKIVTYVACNLRFHPAIHYLKQYFDSHNKTINEVNMYCGSYLPDWRNNNDFRTGYSSQPEMGGGVHLDLIHEIDYCTWLFGKPDNTHSLKRNVSSLGIEAIDYTNYNLIYESFVANITLNYFRRDPKRTLEIVFEDTTWILDLLTSEIRNSEGVIFSKKEFKMGDTYLEQMNYFTNQIKIDQQPMNSVQEAIEVLKICLN